jgi:hypothetical protein
MPSNQVDDPARVPFRVKSLAVSREKSADVERDFNLCFCFLVNNFIHDELPWNHVSGLQHGLD